MSETNTIVIINGRFETVESNIVATQSIAYAISCDYINVLSRETPILYSETTTIYAKELLESEIFIISAGAIPQKSIITEYDKVIDKYSVLMTTLQPRIYVKYQSLPSNILELWN